MVTPVWTASLRFPPWSVGCCASAELPTRRKMRYSPVFCRATVLRAVGLSIARCSSEETTTMNFIRISFTASLIALAAGLVACREKALTAEEGRTATEESALSSQAESLTASSVELSVETGFTAGEAVEDAAKRIQTFVTSQLPCAEVNRNGGKLSIEYGKKSGSCSYNGQTYSGSHTIAVDRVETGVVVVSHTWVGFKNQTVQVDGTATVTWNFNDKTRRVQHEANWTRLSDGRTGKGTGDRTQQPLAGGLKEGIRIDGTRSWEGASGRWDLAINGVELRWQDPVPQSGSYSLDTPFDKSVTLAFARKDASTITVTVTGPRRTFTYNVRSTGAVE